MSQPASSNINRVPIEVWMEIFLNLQTSSPNTKYTYDEQQLAQKGVISVSQTCSSFREIAIGMPRLWTTIFVDFEHPTWSPAHNLNITKLWLERSKNYSLSVSLFYIPNCMGKEGPINDCVVAIFAHVPRWKEAFLSWSSTDQYFWERFDDVIGAPTLLESLIVDNAPMLPKNRGIYRKVSNSHPKKLWTDAPRLQKVVIISPETYIDENENYRVFYEGHPQWVEQPFTIKSPRFPIYNLDHYALNTVLSQNKPCDNIPYGQLTHLRLDVTPGLDMWRRDDLIRIFTSSPNLVACSIEGIVLFEQEVEDKSLKPILLQHLRHLSLGCTDNADFEFCSVEYALDYITAPSLETLTIAGDQQLLYFEPYIKFLERSSCPMEEINFLDTPFVLGNLIPILKLLPTLRGMHLHNINRGQDVVHGDWDLEHSAEERYQMCPILQQLSLSGPNFLESARGFIDDVLDTWLISPTGRQRWFRLMIPSVFDSQVPRDLRGMCDKFPNFTLGFNDHMLVKDGIWDLYTDC